MIKGVKKVSYRRRCLPLASTLFFACIFLVATVPVPQMDFAGRSDVTTIDRGGIEIGHRSLIVSEPGQPLLNTLRFVNSPFAVEIVIQPASTDPRAIRTIASYSANETFNWAIEQHGRSLIALYKNRAVRFDDVFSLNVRHHFIVAITADKVTLYRDSEKISSGAWRGAPSLWAANARFTIANLETGDYPWIGKLEMLQIHTSSPNDAVAAKLYRAFAHGEDPVDAFMTMSRQNNETLVLRTSGGIIIPLQTYTWPRSIKFQNLFLFDKQTIGFQDVVLNLMLTVCLGAALAALFGKQTPRQTLVLSAVIVFFLSSLVETLQFFSPDRVASLVDVLMNVLGSLSGATVWLAVLAWRERRLF
jgi:VanZ like family/Concanavalin A-like lectin/glucanases superfamily